MCNFDVRLRIMNLTVNVRAITHLEDLFRIQGRS